MKSSKLGRKTLHETSKEITNMDLAKEAAQWLIKHLWIV